MSLSSSGPPTSSDEPTVHHSVLIRTHEPHEPKNRWVLPTLVGAAIVIAGAGVWGYMATHPTTPLGVHAVAATSTPGNPG
jgi:nitric oxide reductase large subunit